MSQRRSQRNKSCHGKLCQDVAKENIESKQLYKTFKYMFHNELMAIWNIPVFVLYSSIGFFAVDVMIFSLTHPPMESNIKKLLLCIVGRKPPKTTKKTKLQNHFNCFCNASVNRPKSQSNSVVVCR